MSDVLMGGLALGAMYAMMAMGFSLLWQTSRTINFAQGDFLAVAAFIFVGCATSWSLPLPVAVLTTVIATAALVGYLLRNTLIARLDGRGILPIVVATLLLAMLIQNAFLVYWTPRALRPPAILDPGQVEILGFSLAGRDLAILAAAVLMVGALGAFLTYTRTGQALRGVAQDKTVAYVLGINVPLMITLAFVINAVLLAIAAVLISPITFVKYNMGVELGLRAFYAAIIGGFNTLQGALVGGLIVGVLETVTAAYISNEYKTGVVLLVVLAVILLRPNGLLGTQEVVEYR